MKSVLMLLLAAVLPAAAQPKTVVPAAFAGSATLDATVRKAIDEGQIPGAVLLVWHKGRILHRRAYGFRTLLPKREPMTADTIFDTASLTKVVATTSAIMKLFEEGKIRLNDRVTVYLPEFQGGQSEITVRNLLTHFSGLRPDLDLEPPWSGYETGIRLALTDKPAGPPGAQFVYSDINFILLGEIVRRVSGRPLDEYVRRVLFAPLGMTTTMFRPPARLRPRIAATELLPGETAPLRGIVHDPTTRYMGGVAGHAGVFTIASDLGRFAEMMLGLGRFRGVRLFSPLTVRKFTAPQSPPDQPILRGLGWDIDSQYSSNRGELFPIGSYGHTGFTGTSLWIDPSTGTYVVLLSNCVHPRQRTGIVTLRRQVSTIVAAALRVDAPGVILNGYNETLRLAGIRRSVARNAEVMTGLDVLAEKGFAPLRGKRVGLITNHTGLSREGRRNVDLMLEAGVNVTALFSPEHGISGTSEENSIGHTQDPATGIPVWSLYSGGNFRPGDEMLRDIDALVFDIQDIGTRFYTYISTMGYAMEGAGRRNLPFFVLDRPNPVTGVHVEGPLLDADLASFTGYFPLPLRHGMTAGELARLFNGEKHLGANLHVIPMKNWQRGDWFDSTGLMWVDPSPNMRSLNAALLYPGVALLESSKNYSVGRGTGAPFEQIGAEWIRGRELAAYLNSRYIPGVRVYPTRFQPASSNYSGALIEGVRFVITDREAFDGARLGLEIAGAIRKLFPGVFSFADSKRLIGNAGVFAALDAGEDPRQIQLRGEDELLGFLEIREKYLLYR